MGYDGIIFENHGNMPGKNHTKSKSEEFVDALF